MGVDMLTEDIKKQLVNTAMRIEIGEIPIDHVIQVLDKNPVEALEITAFWQNFNDMTKRVVELLAIEKSRQHLETCYKKESFKKNISYRLSRMFKKLLEVLN